MALAVLGEAITSPIILGIVMFLIGSLLGILPEALRVRKASRALEDAAPRP